MFSRNDVNLHVGQVLEDKGLVKLGIEILPVNLCFVFWFLVGQQINFDEWVRESGGPISRGKVATLNDLKWSQ